VPIVLDVAERAMRRASPSAFLIDFTNPVGIVTRALLSAGYRAVGLCNVAIGFQRHFAALLGVPPDRVALGHVGLNHLTWERSVLVDDKDVLPDLLATRAEQIAPHTGMPAEFLRHLGMVPSYYLRYYYAHDAVAAAQREAAVTRAEEVAALERELLELYADPALDRKPEQLAQRGGAWYSEAAVDLLTSLAGNRRDVQVVNAGNGLTLPFLPADAVIEVPCTVGSGGAVPVPVDPVEPLLRGLIAHVYAYEELALEAALAGGRDRVYGALLAHPLVGQAEVAQCLADRLIAENAPYLPWA
jgi:6-phospho-beta-glucosidase